MATENSATLPMKATCTSWSWALIPFEDVVQIMSLLGFRAIDVGAFAGWAHFEPDELAARPQEMAREILEIGRRHEMELTDLIVTFGPELNLHCVNDPDQSVRDKNLETFKGLTDFCCAAAIPGITLCPGVEHTSLGREASLAIATEELTRLANVGHQAGLRVSFEPHWESITESPEDAMRLVEQVPNLKFTLDYSHFVYQGYTEDQLEPLVPYAGHYHVRQARKGDVQCNSRQGTIDFERALNCLLGNGYDGWVAFEYEWAEWMGNDRVDVISETLVLRRKLASFFDSR